MTTLNGYSLDQLVEIITREVMAAYPPEMKPSCDGCRGCTGNCVVECPDRVREILNAGASRVTTQLGARNVASDLAAYIDHTILKPDATESQIRQLCQEAREYSFATVCVNPTWVALCHELLQGSSVEVCTVIGFPLGATLPEVKAFEAECTAALGATELDMVINVGALKSHDYRLVEHDIAAVVNVAHGHGAHAKVIIEAALLTDEEKVEACAISAAAGADFVKTSTGFGPGGATVADVALMRRVVGSRLGIKAAGGIKSAEDARALIAAGATRLGASAGVKIVQEASR